MQRSTRGASKVERAMPEGVTLRPERNQDGTWGLAAYYLRADGSSDKRVLALCERQSDVCRAMRQLWTDIWRPSTTAADLKPTAP